MLGRQLTAKCSDLFNTLALSKIQYNSVNPHWHDCLDITNQDEVYRIFKEFKPDVVVNCAAFTDVDKTEKRKNLAREINVGGLLNIIKSLVGVRGGVQQEADSCSRRRRRRRWW